MGGVVAIHLDGIPVGKGRPRFVRATGRTYTPPKTRAYEDQLRLAAMVAMTGRRMIEGPVELGMIAHMPIPASWSKAQRARAVRGLLLPTGKPDADNLIKLVDSCNGVVWRDDAQVVQVSLRKRYSLKPALDIFAREIAPAELVAATQVEGCDG